MGDEVGGGWVGRTRIGGVVGGGVGGWEGGREWFRLGGEKETGWVGDCVYVWVCWVGE